MKKLLITLLASTVLVSCYAPGTTELKLNGDEPNLPEELKGLKVYTVSTNNGGYVRVGILDQKAVSTTYRSGKTLQSFILLNKQNGKMIEVKEVLSETDSIIVCKK